MSDSSQTSQFTSQRSLRGLFQRVMTWSSGIACVLHLIFLGIFCALGVIGLAWINVGSVLFYALAALGLALHHRPALWLYLLSAEAIGHGILASYWLGIDSGFYYYMFIVAPCLVLTDMRSPVLKWTLVVGSILVVLVTTVWFNLQEPAVKLSSRVLIGLNVFNLACALASMTFVSLLYYSLVTRAHRKLGVMAATDPLTGLLNRRSLIEHWSHAREFENRGSNGFAVLLCDIDQFKQLNDTHGHEMGDIVLRTIAERLRSVVRATDHVARWGGEEFLILLPDADLEIAIAIAEGLRHAVGDMPIEAGHASLDITLTFGVAHDNPDESIDQAISRADAALYRGKHGGRNCVRHEGIDSPPMAVE